MSNFRGRVERASRALSLVPTTVSGQIASCLRLHRIELFVHRLDRAKQRLQAQSILASRSQRPLLEPSCCHTTARAERSLQCARSLPCSSSTSALMPCSDSYPHLGLCSASASLQWQSPELLAEASGPGLSAESGRGRGAPVAHSVGGAAGELQQQQCGGTAPPQLPGQPVPGRQIALR